MSVEQITKDFELVYRCIPAITSTKETAWLCYLAALATQPQATQGGVWQPIETAPAEGAFLVFMPTEREGKGIQPMCRRKNFSTIGDRFDFDCEPPTHWMPLPAAPEATP